MNKQRGFIQGALLIGIALLAVVIGAFAMASNNNTTDTSKEKIKANAAVGVKKIADLYESYQIAAAQNGIAAADAKMPALIRNTPFPDGFSKPTQDGDLYAVSPGAETAVLNLNVADVHYCAQINRVLGLTSSDDDLTAARYLVDVLGDTGGKGCYPGSQFAGAPPSGGGASTTTYLFGHTFRRGS